MAGKGYNTEGDVLVNRTADGVDLNTIWDEIRQALEIFNTERSTLARLLSYPTIQVADAVPQSWNSESFDVASEFGEPTALREPADYLKLGFDFNDYDKATRFTWKFLREATADQVTAQVTRIFEADNKLVNGTILNRLFNPAPGQNEWGHTTYGLWSGDGMIPPPYLGRTFPGSTTHYVTSGSDVIDAEDIEHMISLLKQKGYGVQPRSQLLILANQDDGQNMTVWRAGIEYRTGGPIPRFDFIPSAALPAYISNETIHGVIPPADYNGLRVWGSYGDAWLIESNYIPTGYVAVVATGGPDSDMNPVGVRSHPNAAYQGLRHIPGRLQNYPLIESFFARGFGVGVRHRGAAAVCQVTTATTYTAPEFAT